MQGFSRNLQETTRALDSSTGADMWVMDQYIGFCQIGNCRTRPIAAQINAVLFAGGVTTQPADYPALIFSSLRFHISSPIPTTTIPGLSSSFPSTKSIAATSATALATFPTFDTAKPSTLGRLSSMLSSHVLRRWSVLDVTNRYCLTFVGVLDL